ncbi:hypothetical protein G3N56_05460 [Desulfovibrio sulfodismutans]|uniref:Type II toxin-antitoxin system RelE/ParE family toxin n=1 Tax=Desulfolutivibrio sulfodismutans TaxID=63561 RepID=A0A7K3NJ21_9BACT|nr:type II toxin-antitoxin system RelE/ParE family toxin [Desulfolutivibrio sulfodismutans]NDY56194.1 hypothetical protein [Desulfolutivibrio sulfodismutans]QLA12373.1 hypothetical protein GD606_08855 [Desulfolutivibrio sulfodismutans DSM 3696]
MSDEEPLLKDILFVGSSRKELVDLDAEVRKAFGYMLCEAQRGLRPTGSKPLPEFGPRVVELVKVHATDSYRCVIYLTKRLVFVLFPFKKKSKTGKEIPKEIRRVLHHRLTMAKDIEKEM